MNKLKIKDLIDNIDKNDYSEQIEYLENISCEFIEGGTKAFIRESYKNHLSEHMYTDIEFCKDDLYDSIFKDKNSYKNDFSSNKEKLQEYVENYECETYQVLFNPHNRYIYQTLHGGEVKAMTDFLKLIKDNSDILKDFKQNTISEVFSDSKMLNSLLLRTNLNDSLNHNKQKKTSSKKI
jgi:hypothetical protein